MTAAKNQSAAAAPAESSARKAWVPKTPVDVVLEQIGKQEKRVAALQKELDAEKALLGKLAKAKAALEA
jgi:hypothetical protein